MLWHHQIAFPDGHLTPGIWDQSELATLFASMSNVFPDADVLDVGCLDGKWTFEAHRYGARSVMAVDPALPPTWHAAHEAFGRPASVKAMPLTLEQLSAKHHERYDVAIAMGVYYHVDDPIGHFRALHRCLKQNGIAIVEGELATDHVEPIARWYAGVYPNGDASVRWVPSLSCLTTWLTYVGFRLTRDVVYFSDGYGRGRAFVIARAVSVESTGP